MALAKPFESVLIANRGEIAVRVARTCRAMDIRSIAVYSDADARALHVRLCDESVAIGGVSPRDSYLRSDLIISAAKRARAQAIHPGYGFLSENADFAQACADAGLVFIGPSPAAMRAVGDKIAAKKAALAAGVPILPGYLERAQSRDVLEAEARKIGVPVLIKAAAGGGGRGMRLVTELAELGSALESAQREAQAAFGDPTVFLERYVASPRHIEVQIIADAHGAHVALGERECSIQRRYQKILEESPSPAVNAELRRELEAAAVAISRAVGYTNAGTVEFMLDQGGHFYFLEMNARLQVEHPITEMVTGIDLVREQLVVASGGRLAIEPRPPSGHALEVRIYAEDPEHGFLPSTGRITAFEVPNGPGVRNDVAVEAGSDVSAAYDPMLAKLIVQAPSRAESIDRMSAALDEFIVGGVATNIGFLRWLVQEPAFKGGATTTDFLERHFRPDLLAGEHDAELEARAAAAAVQELRPLSNAGNPDVWRRMGSWRHAASARAVSFVAPQTPIDVRWDFRLGCWESGSGNHEVAVKAQGEGVFAMQAHDRERRFAAWQTIDGVALSLNGMLATFSGPKPPADAAATGQRHGGETVQGSVQAPMSGTIVKLNVTPGETVKAFQVLLVMEAMKMEHAIVAPYPGVVTTVKAKAGQSVAAGEPLAEIAET